MKSLLDSFAFRLWALFAILGFCLSIPLGFYYNNKNYQLLENRANIELDVMARSASLDIKAAVKSNNFRVIEETINKVSELNKYAFIALLLLSAFFFVLVTNPIRKASRFACELSKTNYTAELRTSSGKNEIGILNNSLITLKHNLIDLKETNDNLVISLQSEIEGKTKEIKVKSRLQEKLQENELKLKNTANPAKTGENPLNACSNNK